MRIVEFRCYRLKPGEAEHFHRIMCERSVPLHREWKMDVVAHGVSLHDPDAYFLIRAFDSLQHLRESQGAFYASGAWRDGPREEIVAAIESDVVAVLRLGETAIEQLRTDKHSM